MTDYIKPDNVQRDKLSLILSLLKEAVERSLQDKMMLMQDFAQKHDVPLVALMELNGADDIADVPLALRRRNRRANEIRSANVVTLSCCNAMVWVADYLGIEPEPGLDGDDRIVTAYRSNAANVHTAFYDTPATFEARTKRTYETLSDAEKLDYHHATAMRLAYWGVLSAVHGFIDQGPREAATFSMEVDNIGANFEQFPHTFAYLYAAQMIDCLTETCNLVHQKGLEARQAGLEAMRGPSSVIIVGNMPAAGLN